MTMWGRTLCGMVVGFAAMAPAVQAADDTPVQWERVQLDARFRSEGVAVGDINKDGKADIVAGDLWYEAPTWTKHEFRPVGDFWAGQGYSNSFCNWTYDFNGDGWLDIVVVGFPGDPFHWYENPKGEAGHWKQHLIWHSICNESPQFADLTGDGKPEFVLGSQPEQQMGYLEIPSGDAVYQKWSFTPISLPGDPATNGTFKYYHGIGVTDLNGDGRKDVVIPNGWWEQPATRETKPWEFHEQLLADKPGGEVRKGADIHSDDLDLDGDQDVIMSSAHQYGLWWFESRGLDDIPGGKELSRVHELWNEIQVARKGDNVQAALKKLGTERLEEIQRLRKQVEPITKAEHRMTQLALYCVRDHLPKIYRAEPGQWEKSVQRMAADMQERDEVVAQAAKDNPSSVRMHTVNELFSQTHALLFVDVNGDGKKDLVTGKRYYAHNGGDPGANDPVVMYWYEIERTKDGPKFIPHEILAGRDTGIGTQFMTADINGDGLLDIALSNKKGVNILLQKRK